MGAWSRAELDRIAEADELEVAWRRHDGSLSSPVTIWVVRHDDRLFVRSAVRGRNAAWYRGASQMRKGRISAGGVEKDVEFVDADHSLDDELDAAYRKKYRGYGPRIVGSCVSPEARSTTLELLAG